MEHQDYMEQALVLAREAADRGEVPVGCVIVKDGRIVGRGRRAGGACRALRRCRRHERRACMSLVEKCALGLVLLFLLVACLRLLRQPLRLALRVLLNSALGFCAVWLLNMTTAVTGMSLGLNIFNALTIGVLGVPGLGLLLLLKWVLV